jgi:hypothetical protein
MGASSVQHLAKHFTDDIADLLAVLNSELPSLNAKSRNMMHPSQKTEAQQRNCSAAWHWTQCDAGNDRDFEIPETLLSLGSLTADRQAQTYRIVCYLVLKFCALFSGTQPSEKKGNCV